MMILSVDDKHYAVHFHYTRHDGRRITICGFHEAPCLRPPQSFCQAPNLAAAHTTCSVNDEFVYKTGRKIALLRAMQKYGVPREQRTAIWRTYFARCGGF